MRLVRRRSAGWRVLGRGAVAVLVLGILAVGALDRVAAASPAWKIGRAVIEPRQPAPVVKLSLRNEGSPGNAPVQILGRWGVQPLPALTLLGRFGPEVAFKQTAILEFPLTPLRMIPPGAPLELVVVTGTQQTDQQWIRMGR